MLGPGNSTDAPTLAPTSCSCAYNTSVNVTTAALVTAYCGVPGNGEIPPLPDDVLTTWPSSPCSSIVGTKALMPLMIPHRLTSSAQRQSFSSCSHSLPSAPAPMPALLHTRCTAP